MVTLVQLTDLHLVADGGHAQADAVATALAAVEAAAAAGTLPLAGLLLTGDLTDAGEPGAYRRLRALVEPIAARLSVPVLCAAGNHDDRAALREHLLGEPASDAPLDHVARLDGLRVVVLDSTVPGHPHGELPDASLAWLAAQLAEPAPDGTVLALHHPPLPSPSRLATSIELRDRHRLAEVVAGTDVRVVLGGHTHLPSAGTLAGIPVWVGGSVYTTWYGLQDGGEGAVAAPSVSRVDLFDDGGVLVSSVPVGAPHLGTLDPARIDELVARAGG